MDDIKYTRADIPSALQSIQALTENVKSAESGLAVAKIRCDALELSQMISTMATLAEIRFSQDMSSDFYFGEKSYYDENLPYFNAECALLQKAILKSPQLGAALQHFSPNVAKVYELSIRTSDKRVAALSAEESALETEYSMLMSGMTFRWSGKNVPLSVLTKYISDEDRSVRRSASEVLGRRLSKNAAELDRIFDDLVKVRAKKAQVMGIADYSVMGDMQFNRYSYGREAIAAYRERVSGNIVPKVAAAKNKIAAELGFDRFMLFDNEVYFKCGSPKPKGDAKSIFNAARAMYNKMGADTAEFFAFMENSGAFDVMPRKNKWGGGFCTNLEQFGQPFILANFNGSSDDVDVLTHEAGHALAFYINHRSGCDRELAESMTMSIAEIHSMAMEFFAYPYAGLFFDRPDDYRHMHEASARTFIPYGCAVDEFEETCYRNTDMTPSERNELWLGLEKKYRPYLTADGLPYLERGTRWQYQSHIYESPMYYIDYCLAGEVALEFHEMMKTDYDGAFLRYTELLKYGGELPLGELCEKIGMTCPIKKEFI